MKRKFICIITTVFIAALFSAVSVMADSLMSGTCSDTVTWKIDDNGVLKISGTGEMNNYYYGNSPWFENRMSVKAIEIGNGITCIGETAFYDCRMATSVVIPDSVTTIGMAAFKNCVALKTVSISDSVTSIGKSAFEECNSVICVDFGNSLKTIDECAFKNCSALTEISVPDTVLSIGYSAFNGCNKLQEITLPFVGRHRSSSGNQSFFGYIFGYQVVSKKIDSTETVTDSEYTAYDSIYAPDGAVYQYKGERTSTYYDGSSFHTTYYKEYYYCFIPTSLQRITITDEQQIKSGVFYNCINITEVVISGSATIIQSAAFENCISITKAVLSDTVEYIAGDAFKNCTSMKSINLPQNVTVIGDGAFENCIQLADVVIPDGVTSVGSSAFRNCTSLTSVIVPDSITRIGDAAFENCDTLSCIFFKGTEQQWRGINIEYNILIPVAYNFSGEKRTFSFVTNGGSAVDNITEYFVLSPQKTVLKGMEFSGWYDNAEFIGEEVSFPYSGEATTLYAKWKKTGKNFDEAFIISENNTYTVNITQAGQIVYYEITSDEGGECTIYSNGNFDTYGCLYDDNGERLAVADDGAENTNFKIVWNAEKGKKYYIAVKFFEPSIVGSFELITKSSANVIGTCTDTVVTQITEGYLLNIVPNTMFETGVIIVGGYKDGRLSKIIITNYIMEEKQFTMIGDFDTFKVMLWSSFSKSKPLCVPEIICC